MRTPSFLRAVGDLVLPRMCAGCERADTWWCTTCASSVAGEPRVFELPGEPPLRVHAVAPYRGAAGRALVAMKERGVVALVPLLGEVLARSVLAARAALADEGRGGPLPLLLVPAPSRPAAVRARGADVVADLAHACADHLRRGGIAEVRVARCLVHARAVDDQTALDAEHRAANLHGALRLRALAPAVLAGRDVVIVDDVLTTGATLIEAARSLRVGTRGSGRAEPRLSAATVAAAGGFGGAFEGESAQTVVAPGAGG